MAARGIRNNNPLNIRHSNSQWLGKALKQTDKAFVQFSNKVYGYRAAFMLLKKYIMKGVNTIGKIIARWAPSSDGNNTRAYISFVSRKSSVDADRRISFEEKELMVEIVRSMAQIESGVIEDKKVIEEAYDMAKES